MTKARNIFEVVLACTVIALLSSMAYAEDWPTYRHDAARSGVSGEQINPPLQLQWTYTPRHAPQPAWPEPGRELNRMAFDYANQVAIAGGMLYFGSSADHAVHALDLDTGHPRWRFFTGGPVRFAPTIYGGRVYAASDDGWLYCLSAADGDLQWRFYGGREHEMLMGNEQLISRWPLRTGVIVEDGVVYFAAGMWPTEGIFVYALDADDGSVLWENNTSGTMYVRHPHPPAKSMSGVAPQGYIVADEDQLFVPTGRNVPAAFDRETGELQYYYPGPDQWADRWGGSWIFTAEDNLFCWRARPGPDIDVETGEHQPWPNDGLAGMDCTTGKVQWEFIGKLHAVVNAGILYTSGGGSVSAHNFEALLAGKEPEECARWTTPHERAYAIIMAGDSLVVGGRGTVTAIAAGDGQSLWRAEVEGQARGLAAADGRVLVSTDTGEIHCFGPPGKGEPANVTAETAEVLYSSDEATTTLAERILSQTGVTEGYCVHLGAGLGYLAQELARRSDLRIWCIEADPNRAARARERLEAAGLYGVRVTVHEGTLADLGYPQYFADLVIAGRGASEEAGNADQVYRLLKPGGGIAYVPSAGPLKFATGDYVRRWLSQGSVPDREVRLTGDAVVVERPPLEGAGQWTHQYGSAARTGASEDKILRLPLKMQWFGRPGPAMMISRHWQGPAPLCVSGRMFVIGQFRITAVDAYNGRELWSRQLEAAGRFPVSGKGANAAADNDSVYVAVNNECLRLDAATGETVQSYQLPGSDKTDNVAWMYLGVTDELVLGTAGDESGAAQLFAIDKATGQPRWIYQAQQSVHHDSVAVGNDAVYLVDTPTAAQLDTLKRRGNSVRTQSRLVGLALDTGQVLWETYGVQPRRDLRLHNGLLFASDGGRMGVYQADNGHILSWGDLDMQRFPVIVGDTVYAQPYAYDLRTGERKQRTHPLTGEPVPWRMDRSYGCGSNSGAPNMLIFRSGMLGFYDLVADSGIHNYGAVRAGCYVNAIPAAGLLLMPPGDAGCTCSYNFQTTVALTPCTREEEWAVFSAEPAHEGITQAALNLGAPGDKRDAQGRLWLGIPRPAGLPVLIEVEAAESYRRSADDMQITGTDAPWLYTNGMSGPMRIALHLREEGSARRTVRLHFAELEGVKPGERVFDVKLQGEVVAAHMDVVAEAGGRNRALVRQFDGIEAREVLQVELVPASGSKPPILSAVEVTTQ